ncbi:MAG TPA: chemotaxis protein CheB [Verrucomicrobiae bacterium]|jgi:two-component system chemotaxis response regulator CheB|nr:chemotaxis protein CheB [Verrucomicrobiae bacterium]
MSQIPVPAEAVVMGASMGAIETLSFILPVLPADYPLPILIVVHLPPDADSLLSELFVAKCRLKVKEAEDKEVVARGTIYFAPANYHLLVESEHVLSLSSDEPELFSRPAINFLFESAADVYGDGLVGIILTGASEDGAHGLRMVGENGGVAVVQDPREAAAPDMPSAALKACPTAHVMTIDEIGTFLARLPVMHLTDVE